MLGLGGGEVIVWDALEGRELLRLAGASWSAAFSPDGRRLATTGSTYAAKVWDATTGEERLTLSAPGEGSNDVGWSPDGSRIVTGGGGGKVRLWHAETGQEMMTWHGPPVQVWSVSFTANGRRLFASGRSDQARTQGKHGWMELWDAPNSAKAVTPSPPDAAWHRRRADHFEATGDALAAAFHLDRVMAVSPAERPELLARRARLLGKAPCSDAMLLARARAVVVAPKWEAERHRLLPAASRFAAASGTALAYRVLGGLQLRAGEQALAVRSLEMACERRAGGAPVEEMLLALTHSALGQGEAARRFAATPDAATPEDFGRVEYELLRDEVRRALGLAG